MAKQGFEHTSKRRHKLRRLAKARKAAEALSKAAGAAPTDDQTKLECRCYEDSMAALELFEKVSHWPLHNPRLCLGPVSRLPLGYRVFEARDCHINNCIEKFKMFEVFPKEKSRCIGLFCIVWAHTSHVLTVT
jgi:hypothetical protein